MRISDWSSDVCSSDLRFRDPGARCYPLPRIHIAAIINFMPGHYPDIGIDMKGIGHRHPVSGGHILNPFYPHGIVDVPQLINVIVRSRDGQGKGLRHAQSTRPSCHRMKARSEEHTSELQSLMRNSYSVFCLKKKKK